MPTVTSMDGSRVSKAVAIQRLYQCMNGPVTCNSKRVTYSREQVDAMMAVMRQLMAIETDKDKEQFKGEVTIAKLIDGLKKYPQDTVVFVVDDKTGTHLPLTTSLFTYGPAGGEIWFTADEVEEDDEL